MLNQSTHSCVAYSKSRHEKSPEYLGRFRKRFNYFLERVARVCGPDHFIIGGGASKKLHKFSDQLVVGVPVSVAQFGNNAGIIGAAVAAGRNL